MIVLSKHARRRFQQRGVTQERLSAILDHADIDRPIGRNCHLIGVSRAVARALPSGERLADVRLIVDGSGGVVTAIHASRNRRGRRYRSGRGS